MQRRPGITGIAALGLLLVVAAPYGGLRLGYPDPGTGPEHLTSRRAYDLVADHFGPGANGPLVLAVEVAGDRRRCARPTVEAAGGRRPGRGRRAPAGA